MAELGLVGDGPNSYQLWLGGSPNQTRLAEAFQDRVKVQVRGLIRRAPNQTRGLIRRAPDQTRLAEAFQDRVKVQVRGLIRCAPDQTRLIRRAPYQTRLAEAFQVASRCRCVMQAAGRAIPCGGPVSFSAGCRGPRLVGELCDVGAWVTR